MKGYKLDLKSYKPNLINNILNQLILIPSETEFHKFLMDKINEGMSVNKTNIDDLRRMYDEKQKHKNLLRIIKIHQLWPNFFIEI